ncbi:hypothetical protein FOA52_000551 [Chlamydomonas sp. UWO 241]|nr:hypothetical protein FOA52_000551 [Chlamydomonas sp. UWO 241]
MFWKVPGFSQPSPVEQILDKDEYTLEELLDEDDIIQECKSLNGRLIAFLRERSSVDQLLRYMVEPQDSDDPKKTYKYPFTSCEVLCCDLEAVFNTLVDDDGLMKLLFSLLDGDSPLSCKTAGYFGRVVGNLLMRKGPEMLMYLQGEGNPLLEALVKHTHTHTHQGEGNPLLEALVKHVGTTSIADVIKRLLGADDQTGMLPPPQMAAWLADTPLMGLLLERLSRGYPSEVQVNAADILSSTAHTQPSPLASKLTEPACIDALMGHALAPGRSVLVPALDVCIALLDPRRAQLRGESSSDGVGLIAGGSMHDVGMGGAGAGADGSAGGSATGSSAAAAAGIRDGAVAAIVGHLPSLVAVLEVPSSAAPRPMPAGCLDPPLGRHRLKVVELLSVLMRVGSDAAEAAIVSAGAVPACLRLFAKHPFNNLLHHSVASMLVACMSSASDEMLGHLFGECQVLEWMVGLPLAVTLPRNPGFEAKGPAAPMRAGYLGHVTQIASTLEALASGAVDGTPDDPTASKVAPYMRDHAGWHAWVASYLVPQQELENTAKWACGRPAAQQIGGVDSDGDEFAQEMDLEQLSGMQQPLYSRYATEEDDEDDDGDEEEDGEVAGGRATFKSDAFGADLLAGAMGGLNVSGAFGGAGSDDPWGDDDDEPAVGAPTAAAALSAPARGIDDNDEVLLVGSDEEADLGAGASPPRCVGGASPPRAPACGGAAAGAAGAPGLGGGGGGGGPEEPGGQAPPPPPRCDGWWDETGASFAGATGGASTTAGGGGEPAGDGRREGRSEGGAGDGASVSSPVPVPAGGDAGGGSAGSPARSPGGGAAGMSPGKPVSHALDCLASEVSSASEAESEAE